MSLKREVPSLLALTLTTAIDNVGHLGDVGNTASDLLAKILPHCTVDQLMHVEKSTKGRDLSPITNHLWKKFYEKEFGIKETESAVIKMNQKKKSCPWRLLYEAKLEMRVAAEEEASRKIKAMYKKEDERKQSRKVQTCNEVPNAPSVCGKKRYFNRDSSDGPAVNCKGNLMKKARTEFMNSLEVKNLAAIKNSRVFSQGRRCSIRTIKL